MVDAKGAAVCTLESRRMGSAVLPITYQGSMGKTTLPILHG
jgi:hypothetical protein